MSKLCHTCAELPITDQGLPLLYKVLISAAAVGSLLAAVGVFCICKKCRKNAENRTDSALCKPTARKVGRTGHREHRDISQWPDGRSGLPAAAVQTISLACDRLVCNYELIEISDLSIYESGNGGVKMTLPHDRTSATYCLISGYIQRQGDKGSSSSTSAANAPAVELEVVDSSAFESEQEPSEQCAVVLRYVTDVVHEKLIAVIDCESSTGQYFVELEKQTLEKMDIDIKKCIGNATDGAANMQGQYKGFSALLTGASPNQVHIWCYSHVLNLVLADTTRVVVASESLFSLLNDIAVFIRDSYKRMKLWEENSEDKRHRRLGVIGETRWWAKDEALRKVFGKFAKPDNALYTDLVITMEKTEKDVTMKPRNKAQGYKAALLKYESILTAEIFLRIFEQTTPLSKYLQTSGMDIASAQHLVTGTEESLRKCARDFQGVMRAADDFVERASGILEKLEDSEAEVQTSLPEKRIRKHKRQPSELTQDEPMANADTDYKINIHNVILDTVIESFHSRYAENAVLCSDVSCMDPRNFPEIREKGLPGTAMKELSKCLLQFDERASLETLRAELISLAQHWERLKQSLMENYNIRGAACSWFLMKYNLLTDAYHIIGLGYKFLLTLSITQVACERTFSTLKLVKSHLRTSLSQDNLEVFLLMATEKENLMELDKDDIIDKMAESSELLRRLLVY
ncbi:hypothetical protein QQF64_019511 [Cirrhinus molitorella]|uniref:Zinc finger MYM-type 1-like protein n=1 Tax=Cirrhinus molitorella TaxID=172907 RepID=A0ABR3LH21_9TELE